MNLSRGEAAFEESRRTVGFFLAPAFFLIVLLLPFPALSDEAHKLAAVMALVATLWITEALPLAVTGLLGPTLVVILGIAPAQKAFAPFADPIMFLFLGAFVIAKAISVHGLDKRFAYRVLSMRWVGDSPGRILFAYGGVCCFISMWISNTATVAMTFPIGVAIIRTLRASNDKAVSDAYATGMMLICAFAASIGGLATPVGTPTNLIGLGFIERQLQRHVGFIEWMSFGVPIVIILYLLVFFYLNYFCRAGIDQFSGIRALLTSHHAGLGPMTKGERNTALAFLLTILLWILPGVLMLILGDQHPVAREFPRMVPESAAALVGACTLFILPINWKKREFTIDLKSALDIDWGVMGLYGGGIALGQLVFDTKLAEAVGRGLTDSLPVTGPLLVFALVAIATFTSEFTSNVASANMVVPIVILIAGSTGLPSALAATMAASLGFMLPISTPTNAIVYSSGLVPLARMVRYGLLLDIIGIIVIFLAAIALIPTQ